MNYENIRVETRGRVALVTLHRPAALNALCNALIAELNHALDGYEADAGIGCIVITGSEKAFAAGADIREMQDRTHPEFYMADPFGEWDKVGRRRKPIIAAVAGYASAAAANWR